MIPMRLIISITVIGVISFFVIQGLTMSYHIINEDGFTQTLTTLQKNIETMINIGHPRDISNIFSPKGTTQMHSLQIPSEIVLVLFGSNKINPSNELDLTNSSVIFYSSQHTGEHVLWCDSSCYFIKGRYNDSRWVPSWNNSVFIINQQGECMITFELITDGSLLYVLVYDENNKDL